MQYGGYPQTTGAQQGPMQPAPRLALIGPLPKKSKLSLVLIIVGIIILVIGLLLTALNSPRPTDYIADDFENEETEEEISEMSPGDEFTVYHEDISNPEAYSFNKGFEGTTFNEGDDVIVTWKIKSNGEHEPKTAQIVGGVRFYVGIILLIIGVILMIIGIKKSKEKSLDSTTFIIRNTKIQTKIHPATSNIFSRTTTITYSTNIYNSIRNKTMPKLR